MKTNEEIIAELNLPEDVYCYFVALDKTVYTKNIDETMKEAKIKTNENIYVILHKNDIRMANGINYYQATSLYLIREYKGRKSNIKNWEEIEDNCDNGQVFLYKKKNCNPDRIYDSICVKFYAYIQ